MRVETPGPTVRQDSGKDPEGRFILSVLVKRTYRFADRGPCTVADEQLPLCDEPRFDDQLPALLVEDTDLFPFKPRTDVIVHGHAYGYTDRREFDASVRVAGAVKRLRVSGDRHCTLTRAGSVAFSTAEPVERIPLSYLYAYGGRDVVAEAAAVDEASRALKGLPPEMLSPAGASPFEYPRNPCGRGYLVQATGPALEKLQLPNLEDPLDPLTPERIAVGSTLGWPRMPLPQATGWVSYEWFPRMVGFGLLPLFKRTEQPFPEVARRYISESVLLPARYDLADPFQMTCGACLDLQLPHLFGGEPVTLQSLHPKRAECSFRLPAERPRIWTDGRNGKLNPTEPVIHTVVIEPDEDRLSVVWRGSAPALRPYMEQELARMPFRVEWG